MSRPRAPMAFRMPISRVALTDRDEHDVHDPDAAHQKRDRGDAGQQQRQHVAHRADRAQELGLGRDRERVGRLTRGDVVALIEQCRDFSAETVLMVASGCVALTPDRRDRGRSPVTAPCIVESGTMHSSSWVPVPPLDWHDPDAIERQAADVIVEPIEPLFRSRLSAVAPPMTATRRFVIDRGLV